MVINKKAQRWELQWCKEIPIIDGIADHYQAKYVIEHFDTLEKARDRAVELLMKKTDEFGCISVQRQEWHYGRFLNMWGNIGERLHFSDTSGYAEEMEIK